MKSTAAVSPATTRGESVIRVFWRCLGSRSTRAALFTYLSTVMRDFFWLQFSVKFGFKKIPILNVDHPLDAAVPFAPQKVKVYLDFIAFWIRPLAYIDRRFGKKVSRPFITDFLTLVNRCYVDAAAVYRYRMTTTKRPKYYRGQFLTIHLFDPHYLCVPSLHVIIVVLAYTFYRKAFAELPVTAEERTALDEEMFSGAIAITETVLFIKQHSVNCIPAALYAMTRITPNEVTPTEVMNFIGRLFKDADNIDAKKAENIRTHIADLYEQLFLQGCNDDDWITPLQRWLNAYSLAGFIN